LSVILRRYLEEIKPIKATDLTYEEIKKQLNVGEFISSELKKSLLFVLEKSDFVKFSDYKPSKEDHALLLQNCYDFIEKTKPLDEKVEESDEESVL
jgi:hypothetical protein